MYASDYINHLTTWTVLFDRAITLRRTLYRFDKGTITKHILWYKTWCLCCITGSVPGRCSYVKYYIRSYLEYPQQVHTLIFSIQWLGKNHLVWKSILTILKKIFTIYIINKLLSWFVPNHRSTVTRSRDVTPCICYHHIPYCFVRTAIGGVVAPSPLCDLAASQM